MERELGVNMELESLEPMNSSAPDDPENGCIPVFAQATVSRRPKETPRCQMGLTMRQQLPLHGRQGCRRNAYLGS